MALKGRGTLFSLAENDEASVSLRIEKMLEYARRPKQLLDNASWVALYKKTERLDPAFDTYVDAWEKAPNKEAKGFEREAGRLLSYFVFRHASSAKGKRDFRRRIAFSALAARHVLAITAARGGSLGDFLDTARLYSSEIEYSEGNTLLLLKHV